MKHSTIMYHANPRDYGSTTRLIKEILNDDALKLCDNLNYMLECIGSNMSQFHDSELIDIVCVFEPNGFFSYVKVNGSEIDHESFIRPFVLQYMKRINNTSLFDLMGTLICDTHCKTFVIVRKLVIEYLTGKWHHNSIHDFVSRIYWSNALNAHQIKILQLMVELQNEGIPRDQWKLLKSDQEHLGRYIRYTISRSSNYVRSPHNTDIVKSLAKYIDKETEDDHRDWDCDSHTLREFLLESSARLNIKMYKVLVSVWDTQPTEELMKKFVTKRSERDRLQIMEFYNKYKNWQHYRANLADYMLMLHMMCQTGEQRINSVKTLDSIKNIRVSPSMIQTVNMLTMARVFG